MDLLDKLYLKVHKRLPLPSEVEDVRNCQIFEDIIDDYRKGTAVREFIEDKYAILGPLQTIADELENSITDIKDYINNA